MKKRLFHPLIIAFVGLTCLEPFNRSQAFHTQSEGQLSTTNGKTSRVEVTFDGLMVFRRVGNHYEVGILSDDIAVDHEFKITRGIGQVSEKNISALTTSAPWSLNVVSSMGNKPPDIKPRQNKPCNRLQDSVNGETDLDHVFDFCWITDLESEFLDGRTFPFKPNALKQVILLNNGELYAKFKYDFLMREQTPDGDLVDFGFVAETIALTVTLQQGEKLVLSAGNEEIFSLPRDGSNAGIFHAPKMNYLPTTRPGHREHSHFLYYYELFNLDAKYKKDIQRKVHGRRPLNRFYPDMQHQGDDYLRNRTFDRQACGAVLLGKSTNPLR